jgi:hypothetical protein
LYDNLPSSLKQLVGKVKLPPDGGKGIIKYLNETNTPLIVAADASLKDHNCTHAWIVTTNNKEHFGNEELNLNGMGAVDGNARNLSSTRGEIHGQTAGLHMANILLQAHNATNIPIQMSGDNKGVQSTCATNHTNRLREHRGANFDLFSEYKRASKGIKKTTMWVKSHQDEGTPWTTTTELKDLKLSTEATLNVWCDR